MKTYKCLKIHLIVYYVWIVFKAERLEDDSTKINSQNEQALSIKRHQLND